MNNHNFEKQSIELLQQQLKNFPYEHYPDQDSRFVLPEDVYEPGLYIPEGPWSLQKSESQVSAGMENYQTDSIGRPLHPWMKSMTTNAEVGALANRGFFRNWGENHAADAIVLREIDDDVEILLIKRRSPEQWALPGGFIEPDEEPVTAAQREAEEETQLPLARLSIEPEHVYTGPVADVRMTAHAWPVTHAYKFVLPPEVTLLLPEVKGGDDALEAKWVKLHDLHRDLFGSHVLLIELATGRKIHD